MKKSCRDIRREFIEFFQQRGHRFVASSSLLPADDPTLLFANAGMNQFKDIFLGLAKPACPRVVNSQKCIRAGGKHNDLEDVGHDTYHHTFFEMLGNWSFGDYFKAEAIEWAWELLTKVWGLPKERLYATVFQGDKSENLAPDNESAELWRKKTDIDPSHIRFGGKKDNFWEMGEIGPCGPCSEIHYDFTADCSGGKLVNAGDPRVIEIWNLVFIQFNRTADGKLETLPARHVDTGMGLERICRVIQGVDSNYDIDIFRGIFSAIEKLSPAGRYGGKIDDMKDVAYRVVADHARCLTFAIADGVIPSNEGRGYVLRRILRRAARYGRQYLKIEGPFLCKLVPTVVELMGDDFPEIRNRRDYIIEAIRGEEESFGKTLDNGIKYWWTSAVLELYQHFSKEQRSKPEQQQLYMNISPMEHGVSRFYEEEGMVPITPETKFSITVGKDSKTRTEYTVGDITSELICKLCNKPPCISGEDAFKLYATYGFPIDLTQLMARERGIDVDIEGFEKEMEAHREISSAGAEKFKVAAITGLPATDDSAKYSQKPIEGTVLGWVVDGKFVTQGQLPQGSQAAVVLDKTCFYAESGGQVGDSGELTWSGGKFAVSETAAAGDCVLHVGVVVEGKLAVGEKVRCQVNQSRMDTMRNHTATHLLNWALREVLGSGVNQAGSEVASERLRFDFTHSQAVKAEELAKVETLVNQRILADEPVSIHILPLAAAMKIPGVRAVFGEKYPDPVRVIAIGTEDPISTHDPTCAVEFCGGTHLGRTGQIGLFKIVSEESVAKGIRRITALTGRGAVEYVQQGDAILRQLSGDLRTPVSELSQRVAAMQKELKGLRKRPAAGAGEAFMAEFTFDSPSGKILVGKSLSADPQSMRTECDKQRQKGAAAIFIAAVGEDGKVTLVAMVSEDLVKGGKIKAGEWVKAVAPVVGGSGGGKPTLAQAGGKDAGKLDEAIAAAAEWVKGRLK